MYDKSIGSFADTQSHIEKSQKQIALDVVFAGIVRLASRFPREGRSELYRSETKSCYRAGSQC